MPVKEYPIDQVESFYIQYLEGFSKFQGGNRATAFCPFHDDVDHKSFSVNLRTGLFKCFADSCGVDGNAISFARRLRVPIPAWAGGRDYRYIFSKMMPNDRTPGIEYLLMRGIPENYINYLNKESLFACDDWKGELCIVFPIFDRFSSIIALNKINLDTNEKRTIGSYLGGFWIDTNFEFKNTICLVEGVINALTLNSIGIPALAIITCNNSYESTVFSGLHVILMLDNDAPGRSASRRLNRELLDDACSIKSIVWHTNAQKGYDANDILRHENYPDDYVVDLIENAQGVDEWMDYVKFWRLVRG